MKEKPIILKIFVWRGMHELRNDIDEVMSKNNQLDLKIVVERCNKLLIEAARSLWKFDRSFG